MWERHEVVFRLLSPLHIGAGRVGNLQRTRGYVPGRVMWAAVTARLARSRHSCAAGEQYENAGQEVDENLRFSYFFPALAAGEGFREHRPWDAEFSLRFLGSYASTALTCDNASAEDGTLHETEMVLAVARPAGAGQKACPVYLAGAIWSRMEYKGWLEALAGIQLGAERSQGWGRVRLVQAQPRGGGPEPAIHFRARERLTAHADESAMGLVRGRIEPWVGWERNSTGESAWKVSAPRTCFEPGAEVTVDCWFTIGSKGVLEHGRRVRE